MRLFLLPVARCLLPVACGLLPVSLPAQAAPDTPVILLTPDRVFDGVAMRTGWSVLVRGDRILAAGPNIA
ncbi:MAG TPA: hypothetical protein VJ817_00250, partial [Gemmatimonadales bacterium]|nr:hypothetical protein [Gemmatimonadales bacterium]